MGRTRRLERCELAGLGSRPNPVEPRVKTERGLPDTKNGGLRFRKPAAIDLPLITTSFRQQYQLPRFALAALLLALSAALVLLSF